MAFDGTLKFDTAIDKSGFESGLSALGGLAKKGMAAITGAVTAAAGGVAMFAKSSLEAYASYEQLVGGTELLFGEAYDYIVDKSKEAYKTVQMSQNDYLQQVNGFSTGLKTALGGNIQAAAELADRIVNAEADVVAATGNTQEAVQNAFNGIMKSNYTMLDNLQLGIAPTKQGFEELIDKVNEWNAANGKATAYQIDNLADCESALVDYIEMQGLAGYAANEASATIEGSVSAMKAAWANLTVEIAKDDADIEGSISALTESLQSVLGNIIPRAEQVLSGIGDLVANVAPIIAEEVPKLVSTVLPPLLTAATGIISSFADAIRTALPTLIGAIIEALPDVISAIKDLASNLLPAIAEAIGIIADGLPGVISTLGKALSGLAPILVGALRDVIVNVVDGLTNTAPVLLDAVLGIITSLGDAIIENWPTVLNALYKLIPAVINFIADGIPKVLEVAEHLITKAITELVPEVIAVATEQLPAIITAITQLVPKIETAIAKILPRFVETIITSIPMLANALTDSLPVIIEAVITALNEMYPAVHEAIATLITSLADLMPMYQETLYEVMPQLLKVLAELIVKFTPELIDLAKGVFISMVDMYIKIIPSLLENLFTVAKNAVVTGFNMIVEAGEEFGRRIPDIIDAVVDWAKELPGLVIEWLSTLPERIESILSVVIPVITDWSTEMTTKARETAQTMLENVVEWLGNLPERVGYFLATTIANIVKWAIEAPSKMREAARTMLENVIEFISKLPERVHYFVTEVLPKIQEWGVSLREKGRQAALDFFNVVVNKIKELPSQMLDIGTNIVTGIWNGIQSAKDWLANQIGGFASGIVSGFKDAFQISSPSRVMRDSVGKYIAEGIGVGFTENIPDLTSVAQSAIDELSEVNVPEIKVNISDFDTPDDRSPKPRRIPQIDSTAFNALDNLDSLDRNIAPTSTAEIISNYNYSTTTTTNNSTAPESVPPNITLYATIKVGEEIVADGVVDIAADKIDERQGVTVELKKRGLAR